ncbi:hypothetical protein SUGI_0018500 [Cryptomeria japonica]|nr:hypothetical protein SUGI_0018500 [Cryptomeria japonica]
MMDFDSNSISEASIPIDVVVMVVIGPPIPQAIHVPLPVLGSATKLQNSTRHEIIYSVNVLFSIRSRHFICVSNIFKAIDK